MAKHASNLADEIYITDDNPRDENPKEIRQQIFAYCKNAVVIANRKKAIRVAIKKLKKYDMLLVEGKGHERHQEIKGKRYFFNDKKVVLDAIREMEV